MDDIPPHQEAKEAHPANQDALEERVAELELTRTGLEDKGADLVRFALSLDGS